MAIIRCSCESKYQDKKYGAGRRVANETAKSAGAKRCTVCGVDSSGSTSKSGKKK